MDAAVLRRLPPLLRRKVDKLTAHEAQTLLAQGPELLAELHALFVETIRETVGGMSPQVRAQVMLFRLVGVPERDPREMRPVASVSIFLRTWHRCQGDFLPTLSVGQRSGSGVGRANINWAQHGGESGADVELPTVFGSVQVQSGHLGPKVRGDPTTIQA